jgi:ParB/RepB/Spo0J family partition protein
MLKAITETRLPLSVLAPDPKLRSVDRDSVEYKEFVANISKRGVMQPILVRPIAQDKRVAGGPEFLIIDGLQRFSASKDSGLDSIPVRVVEATESETIEAQIIANAQRIEVKPKEYAGALKQILDANPMMTSEELANRLDKSYGWLNKMLTLNGLTDEVGELVDTGKIGLQNAIILAKLKKPEDQEKFAVEAQTKDPGTFGANVQQYLTEQRKARNEGRPEGPVEYQPKSVLLKIGEVEALAGDTQVIQAFLRENGQTGNSDQVIGAQLAFQRCLQLDPVSVTARKAQHEADKQQREVDAARKKEEKEKQKLLDAQANRERLTQQLAGV